MSIVPPSRVELASAVFSLSKTAWRLGISISRLEREDRFVDTRIENLSTEVKSLGNECDLMYAELEGTIGGNENGTLSPCDVGDTMRNCIAAQVDETSRTMRDLDILLKSLGVDNPNLSSLERRSSVRHRSSDQIASIRKKVRRHTGNLQTTLLLVKTVAEYIVPYRSDQNLIGELDRLQNVVDKLRESLESSFQMQPSRIEATLMQCAREVIVKGTALCDADLAAKSAAGDRAEMNLKAPVMERMHTLAIIRHEQACPESPSATSNTVVADTMDNNSDDDLEIDLVKAAIETGASALEAQDWDEADSLLREAVRALQQLSKQQRSFCDPFDLQFKLTICAYHIQNPADAMEALINLIQLAPTSEEQRRSICEAMHLLSLLYIRAGQIEQARIECEKALQARRRLLGKRSEASLESTALMAHIYVLLNNNARAKSYLAMIPEANKQHVLRGIEQALGTKLERFDSPQSTSHPIPEDSDSVLKQTMSRLSMSSLASSVQDRCYGPVSTTISQAPTVVSQQIQQRSQLSEETMMNCQSVAVISISSTDGDDGSRSVREANEEKIHSPERKAVVVTNLAVRTLPKGSHLPVTTSLSRKEILEKIGCQPRDRIEAAVCDSDSAAFTSLMKRKSSWRLKLRPNVRSERVTALHFAALFGEIDMARQLLDSGFNINEVPFGYSTCLTPLKFAVGARQVAMVEFLTANNAKPSKPDSWSTLAGQLMNRSWLTKTISEAEKEFAATRMIAILETLLKCGLDIDEPIESSGRTILHQAVSFWTGSYKWDLNVRTAMTTFLCDNGASPFRKDTEGKTPYDIATTSDHQDLLLILDRGPRNGRSGVWPAKPVELAG